MAGEQVEEEVVRTHAFFVFSCNGPEVSQFQEPRQYLESPEKELSMLHRFPNVKKLFIKYNSGLPSSAPVERLFSMSKHILTQSRNRLSDNTFEQLLLLKVNKEKLAVSNSKYI